MIETFKHLKKLKRKKDFGIDNLPPRFLKETAFNITKPLTILLTKAYAQVKC